MRPFCKIILIMAVSLFGLAAQARAPRGNLVYCSYSKTGAAGLGRDYCELVANPGADPVIKVVLNESNRFNEPTIRKEYPGTTEALKEIQEWAKKNKIYKLDGYDLQERISGGTTYRVRLEYDSGDSITIRWYGHGVDEQASSAYAYVSSYFRPWRERALKESEPITECFILQRSTATRATDACRLLCQPGFTPAVVIDLNVGNFQDPEEYHAQFNVDEESVQELLEDLAKMGVGSMKDSAEEDRIEGGSHTSATLTFQSGRKLSLSWRTGPGAVYDRLDRFFAPWKEKAKINTPKGNLVYCSYSKTGSAGLGRDYCELVGNPGAAPVVNVVLNENDRNEPEIRKEYPATAEALKEIQEWAEKSQIYLLNGYNQEEKVPGGSTYRVYLEFDSGDRIDIRWYGHNVNQQASAAYDHVSSFFEPWRERALKEARP